MPKFPQHQRLSAVHLSPAPVPARRPISPPHPRCVRAELHSPSLRDLRKPPAMLPTSSEEERGRPRDVCPRGRHAEVLAPIAMVRHRGNLQRLPYLPSKLPGCRMSFLTMGSVRMALDFLLADLARSIDSSGYSHLIADHRSTPSRSVRHCVHRRPPSPGVQPAGFEPRRVTSLLAGTAEHAKTQDAGPAARREPVATRRTAEPGDVVPTAAPVHPDRPRLGSGIWARRALRWHLLRRRQ